MHSKQVRFYVIEKATGKVLDILFTAPACFVFHHINAYEEDGDFAIATIYSNYRQWWYGEIHQAV